jgi:hypothetical protein
MVDFGELPKLEGNFMRLWFTDRPVPRTEPGSGG